MSNVLYLVDDYWGCGWYRCHVPGIELKRHGHEVVLHHTPRRDLVEDSDIIVFQRQHLPEALAAMEYANRAGKVTVYELDDDLWNIQPTNPAYPAWHSPGLLDRAEAMLRAAKVVTTTTPVMAAVLKRFNPNVRVLPNMLPSEHWVGVERERHEGRTVIGWAGSAGRGADVKIIQNVVWQVLDVYPDVEFEHTAKDGFPKHPRVRELESVMIEQYPKTLARFDIALAPVADNRFNQAKSDLKFVEYGMLGLPVIASHVEPYAHSIVQGESGFLAKNDKDWLKYLRRLIDNPALRDEIGGRAKKFAESRTIEAHVDLWAKAYGIPLDAPGFTAAAEPAAFPAEA